MASTQFTRDSFTWLAYLMLGYFAFIVSTLGPLMPFLSSELQLNYSQVSLHFSAGALGALLVGTVGDRIVSRVGRHTIMWLGAFGLIIGYLGLAVGSSPLVTIGGLALSGIAGGFLLLVVQSGLADHHGERRAIALAEGNTGASLAQMLAPFLVGTFQRTGIGWRGALYVAAALAFGSLLFFKVPTPASRQAPADADRSRRLPTIFWIYCLVLALETAVEWSMGYWGAPFLQGVVRLADVDAATAMALFYLAMFGGRALGSRLTRSVPSATLFVGASGVAMTGILLFWLGQVAPLNILGLFVAGLGIANMYPQIMALALSIVPHASNTATARIGLVAGMAIFLAPQILGQAADRIGLQNAFGIVALFLGLALACALFANDRLARRAVQPI